MRGSIFGALVLSGLISCKGEPEPEVVGPGELQVGMAQVRMPAPLGIGTVGFGGFGVDSNPSPFAEIYPATERIHNHPDFRVMVLSRGEGHEVILVRTDTVGIFQQLRRAVLIELEERLGRDLDDALIIGATHTHSGPGRVIDGGGPFDLIADRFFPEFYERMVDAIADSVEQAYADLRPAELGVGFADVAIAVDDRRCEDGLDYVNGNTPIIAVRRDDRIVGIHTVVPIHGTVLGIEELTLSQDVSGGIEQGIEDGFDYPVHVQMFNAWAADMSPGNPEVAVREGASQPDGYDRMERIGLVVGEQIHLALEELEWTNTPELKSETVRVPINRVAIGYAEDEFQYDYGAVYCGAAVEADCDGTTFEEGLTDGCVPFNVEFPAPMQTMFTAGQVADLSFITFPGEPGTLLAEQVMDEIRSSDPDVGDIMFMGYAQDYLGYSILEDDWYNGGYEASGALWGPRQGAYLASRAAQVYRRVYGLEDTWERIPRITPFDVDGYEPYVAPVNPDFGSVFQDVAAQVEVTEEVVVVVEGADPWFGAPVARLVDASGAPVLRPNGTEITSDGQAFWVELSVDPPYVRDQAVSERNFRWAYHFPVQHQQAVGLPALEGNYRIEVALPDGTGAEQVVSSSDFTVVR